MHRIESPLAMDKMDAELQECPAPMPTAGMDDSKSSHDSDDGLDRAGTNVSPQQSDDKLAKKETRAVMWMRLGLTVILIAAALVVSLSVFFYSRNTETKTFESAVADSSIKIIESFQSVAEQRLGAIASMAVMITSHALSTNATWPFVTVPNFEAQGWHALALMDAEGLIFSPIVSHQDRAEWENNYAPEHIAWVNESKAYQDSINYTYLDVNPGGPGTRTRARNLQEPEETSGQNTTTEAPQEPPNNMPDFSLGYSKEIYAFGPQGVVVSPEKEKYMAWWQRVPGTISGVNMDINIDPTFGGDLLSVMERGHVGLGTMTLTAYGEFGAPVSGFYYPVLQELHHSAPAVASLGTQIFWDSFLTDILPENINGLYVVLSNTCDQQFTFMLNGPNVQNIGEGDLHDPDFDEYKEEASFTDLVSAGAEAGNYLGVEIDQTGCQYSLAIYPSSQMQDGYMTSQPVVLLISALFIFLVTSLTFLLYDHLVERRQKLVTQEAKKSGAIVDSLFPEAYRDRLMQAEEDKLKEQNSKNKKFKVSRVTSAKIDPSQLITNFMKNSDTNSAAFLREHGQDEDDDEPIADLYQDCTVFFADIAGFTAWSSARCPSDVFRLLGTVYGAFDKLAERRGVFKVETIGDSYMCVTGLPEPQKDHARRMARFAQDATSAMNRATLKLAGRLGDDTRALSLRMGMHSGPVTAGILKGAKSRFQLFGDTVNTASRMESTGEKYRIQLSSATADLLKTSSLSYMITPRDDLVEAKGKGKLQTYWLAPKAPRGGSTATSMMSSSMPSNDFDSVGSLGSLGAISDLDLDDEDECCEDEGGKRETATRVVVSRENPDMPEVEV